MEQLMCSLLVIVLGVMSLFLALLVPTLMNKGGQKKGGDEAMSDQTFGKGHDGEPVDAELNANMEDSFELIAELVNQMRDELGLPRLPIETLQGVFGKMSKGLRKQLEWHIGPIFKDNASGWVSLMLEMIGEHNKNIAQLLIDGNKRGMELLKLEETCKFSEAYLETALASVDRRAAILAKHGEEKAEDVRRFMRRQVTYQIESDFLSELPGAQKGTKVVEVGIEDIIPPVPTNKLESQTESVGAKDAKDEVFDSEIVDLGFSSNGKRQREEERAWKEHNR